MSKVRQKVRPDLQNIGELATSVIIFAFADKHTREQANQSLTTPIIYSLYRIILSEQNYL
jgi:hypothetical protein